MPCRWTTVNAPSAADFGNGVWPKTSARPATDFAGDHPGRKRGRGAMVARNGVAADLDCLTLLPDLVPDLSVELLAADGPVDGRFGGRAVGRLVSSRPQGREAGAQPGLPAQRRGHADRPLRGCRHRPKAAVCDTRKTTPGLARVGEASRPRRRRDQPPHRPLRRHSHQGQSPGRPCPVGTNIRSRPPSPPGERRPRGQSSKWRRTTFPNWKRP